MDERRDPDELRDLLGAFALGAVDDEERARVEDLLLHDPDARAELHQLEHAVAWLGHASPRPTNAAWDAVRAEMDRDLAAGASVAPAASAAPAAAATPPVVELSTRRAQPRRARWQQLTAIAAAIALVVGVGLAVGLPRDSDSTVTTVALAAPDGRRAVTATIDAEGAGRILQSSLPAPPAGHEYQLWAQADEESAMSSAGLLGREPDGHEIRIPPSAVLIAISVEPTGGSASPTTDPVAVSAENPL